MTLKLAAASSGQGLWKENKRHEGRLRATEERTRIRLLKVQSNEAKSNFSKVNKRAKLSLYYNIVRTTRLKTMCGLYIHETEI